MLVEASLHEFERAPLGRFTHTASCVVWCASAALVGWHVWGRPDENETRALLHLLAQYPKIGPHFDVIADTRGVEILNPPAVALLVRWALRHRAELKRRVRVQANVIRRDSIGFLLLGIIASVGDPHPLRTFGEPLEAFRSVAGDAGTTLCSEIETIVARLRSSPHELQTVRTLLRADPSARIEDAAKQLLTSPRSLQRTLHQHGTSFHAEQTDARFALAQALLGTTDDKIVSVAHRVGWSERTLTSVFRARAGVTPTDWRKRG